MTITQDRLKEMLSYEPETGIFIWKRVRNFGEIAGSKNVEGYLKVMIDSKMYALHRLAWLYVKGYLPENNLDHINKIRDDNRICNLREASRQCNKRNSKKHSNNKSGITGIFWNKTRLKWTAQIAINAKHYHLGLFKDYDEAICTRLAAEQCLNWSDCDSTSPAYQYVQEHITKKGACNEDDRL